LFSFPEFHFYIKWSLHRREEEGGPIEIDQKSI
jgi:hypothetical protein